MSSLLKKLKGKKGPGEQGPASKGYTGLRPGEQGSNVPAKSRQRRSKQAITPLGGDRERL